MMKNATPRYFVRVTYPRRDNRDAIVGSTTYRDEMTYYTVAGAMARARCLGDDDEFFAQVWDQQTERPVTYADRNQALCRALGLNPCHECHNGKFDLSHF